MNSRPMILRFSSGSALRTARRGTARRVDNLEVDAGRGYVVPFDLLGFTLPQQTMIDKDTGQLATDRALHQSRRDAESTRQRARR